MFVPQVSTVANSKFLKSKTNFCEFFGFKILPVDDVVTEHTCLNFCMT